MSANAHRYPDRPPLIEIGQVVAMMAARMDELVGRLGLQGRREGNEFVAYNPTRADNHLGSFRICLYGAKAGVWADFAVAGRGRSGAKGGDALDLVAYVRFGDDKKQAIQWAKAWLGLADGDTTLPAQSHLAAQRIKPKPVDPNPHRGIAQKIWLEGRRMIRATPVEMYLAGRGIDLARLQRLPGSLRYHPRLANPENPHLYPAMVASVQDGEGAFVAVHRTWLDETANAAGEIVRVAKAPLTDAKRTLGTYAPVGGFIPIWRGASGQPIRRAPAGDTVAVTEGIEDALTVALAVPELRVICAVTVTNMGNVALPDAIRDVILIADNDTGEQAIRALGRAIEQHRAKGRTVKVARAGGGAKDMNERLARAPAATTEENR